MAQTVQSRERPSRSPRTTRSRVLVLGSAVALVAGLGTAAWWWRHPETFRPADSEPTVGLGERQAVSEGTLHLRMSHVAPESEGDGVVTLRSAEPRVLVNDTDASFEVSVCTPVEGGIIGVTGPLERWCSDVSPVDGTNLDLEPGGAYVVLSVTPTRPGQLRVQGVDLAYSDGLRSGTQPVGHYLWLRFR